jgi:hypothetical protein
MNRKLLSMFQATNPEKFNDEVIYMRRNENIHSYFQDLFKTLSLPGIEFLSSKTITDETEHEKYIPKRNLRIEENRLDLVEANFKLTYEEEVKDVTIHIFFPKIIDNFFFQLNGNKFFAIYQITDKNYYSVRKGLFLKTLLMPLGLKFFEFIPNSKTDTHDELVNGKVFRLEFFKTKANKDRSLKNALVYMYIKYGVMQTLTMFGMHEHLIISEEPLDGGEDFKEYHRWGNVFIYYHKSLIEDKDNLNFLCTFLDSLSDVKKFSSIETELYWKKKILTSATSKIEKADKAMVSLERILDERTKKNLRDIPAEQKEDIYGVIQYMIQNFTYLFNLDNVDIYNRRIRLIEYLIFPLLTKFSDLSYRMLNSRNMDMNRLTTVFSNIGSMFIIKRLVKNELLRYSNATNSLELFSVALKWSGRGPQSLGSSSGNTLIKYRGLHKSYINNLSLNASSSGDPGLSGTIIPFCRNINDMFFEDPNKE